MVSLAWQVLVWCGTALAAGASGGAGLLATWLVADHGC